MCANLDLQSVHQGREVEEEEKRGTVLRSDVSATVQVGGKRVKRVEK